MQYEPNHAQRSAYIAEILIKYKIGGFLPRKNFGHVPGRCCAECRAEFNPTHPKAITCSERCANRRKKRLARGREDRRMMKRQTAV